ncbi:MAG: hypothetical protein NG737_07255 [Omnitrophica bacterium]|nr:hypothetical protein [Candidatus Omnitrophota bacterium]
MSEGFLEKVLSSGLLIAFLVGVVLILIGFHLIINNRVVAKNLLQGINLFQTKEVEKKEIEIKPSKLISGRIGLYIAGGVFASMGLFLLLNFIRRIIGK